MTKRLDRLESLGRIRRQPDPNDRRGRLIALTDVGRALCDRAVEAHLENEERLLAELPVAKREQLAALLRELLIALDERAPTRRV
jgi:DNA-binding MarR family transcriptional regulator